MAAPVVTAPTLLSWIERPRRDAWVRFAEDKDWTVFSHEELAARSCGAAGQLLDLAVPAGARVALILPTGPDFVAAFFGCVAAGCVPVSIAPPETFQGKPEYEAHLARLFRSARPAAVVTSTVLAGMVAAAGRTSDTDPTLVTLSGRPAPFADIRPERVADDGFIQYTSGSSGHPRGVQVRRGNLETHMARIAERIAFDGSEDTVSWLPLHHDMGLVGCLLTVLAFQGNLTILRPSQFVRAPLRWLECIGKDGASLTASPTFGFAHALRRIRKPDLAGLDLSAWRVAIVGAERVHADVLRRFAELCREQGFDATTFFPAYGLAEATLAVTVGAVGDRPVAIEVDRSRIRFGAPVPVGRRLPLDEVPDGAAADWLVSNGAALRGSSVAIVDERGDELAGATLGEVVVRSTSLGDGYVGAASVSQTRFEDGRLFTGDAGFVVDGELYIVGRMADSVSIAGRNVYMEDLEVRLGELPELARRRFVVLGGVDEVVAVIEARPAGWMDDVRRLLVRKLGSGASVRVVAAPRGTILRTTSGKPRRKEMWRQLVHGELPGTNIEPTTPTRNQGVEP